MNIKKRHVIISGALVILAACAQIIFAQVPEVNIGERHGNLRAAQSYIVQAFQRIDDAQVDNNYRLGGHAGRAKDYLVQADRELRLAADAANHGGR
jgi:hypothetical protein